MLIQENMEILDCLDVFLFESIFLFILISINFILINFQMYFTKNYKLNK